MDIMDPVLPAEHIESSSTAHAITGNRIRPALLETVNELTGYPQEMLGLDMDIEADLGIDFFLVSLASAGDSVLALIAMSSSSFAEFSAYFNDITRNLQ